MSKTKVIFSEDQPSYKKHFKGFVGFCKESEMHPFKSASIMPYMQKLREGYPNNKPKRLGTLKNKMAAIKKHYELNKRPLTEFKDFSSQIKAMGEL